MQFDPVTPPGSQRFFFVHLQKTAGTTLFQLLKRQFGEDAVYPNPSDGPVVDAVLSPERLQARWRARGDEIRVVTGHFPLCVADLLDGPFVRLTLLRHPVPRTLSYLRHHRKMTPADRDAPLEQIYEDPLRFHGLIHNHMVKMFSLTPAEMDAGVLTRVEFTPARLERAKERLASVEHVGLQERFAEFCDELERAHGWDLERTLHSNRTEPVEVDDSLVERITEDNALDIELYQFAVGLHEERRRRAVDDAGT